MPQHFQNQDLTAGVVGGTVFSSVVHIGAEDVITTIVPAVLGAVVSFLVSVLMKLLFNSFKKQRKK
ncbi:hypothetical protein [uncultured Polaribacter sp.]|uniref:hypothetical protein n=1 Tax=uncultured Polaribacter sp. TaxID=174711 RepID=UPI00260A14BC|nr:hypothetical protein [uncultured Polaribacter sp.]